MIENKEFLEELTVMVRAYGWSGDHVEIERFARWCYRKKTGEDAPCDHFEPPEWEEQE